MEDWKLALYGIIAYPDGPAGDVASLVGLSLDRFLELKTRLHDRGCYYVRRKPIFHRLDYDVLLAAYGVPCDRDWANVDEVVFSRWRVGVSLGRVRRANVDEVVFSLQNGEEALAIGYAWDTQRAEEVLDQLHADDTWGVLLQREEITAFHFFNFARVLYRDWDLDLPRPPRPELEDVLRVAIRREQPLERRLTILERRVFLALVEMPEANDREIARALGEDWEEVRRTRHALRRDGLYRTLAIPDMQGLGYEYIAFEHIQYKSNGGRQARISHILEQTYPHVFLASSPCHTVVLKRSTGNHILIILFPPPATPWYSNHTARSKTPRPPKKHSASSSKNPGY